MICKCTYLVAIEDKCKHNLCQKKYISMKAAKNLTQLGAGQWHTGLSGHGTEDFTQLDIKEK